MKTKVFISWSGVHSRKLASHLKSFIEKILPLAEPWMSENDIGLGTRWYTEIIQELDAAQIGIICINKENQQKPWISFEAGALSKHINKSRVIPYVTAMRPADISAGPLTMFQAIESNEQDTFEMIKTINSLTSEPRSENIIKELFDAFWPKLKTVIDEITEKLAEKASSDNKSQEDIQQEYSNKIDEILENTRFLMRTNAFSDILPVNQHERLSDDLLSDDFFASATQDIAVRIFNEMLRRADLKLRAFMKPAVPSIIEGIFVIDIQSRFHAAQAKSRFNDLTKIFKESCKSIGIDGFAFELVTPTSSNKFIGE